MDITANRGRRALTLFRVVSVYAVLSILAGCSGWQRQHLQTDRSMETDLPRELRVELRDGTQIVLLDAVRIGDALEGWAKTPEFPGRSDAKLILPLSAIESISVPASAEVRFVAYVATLLVVGVAVIGIAFAASGGGVAQPW